MQTQGERFASALAAKDAEALSGVLAASVDFQALTPGRHWMAETSGQVVSEIILGEWFGPEDIIAELRSVSTGQVSEREHVAYQVRVTCPDGEYLVEQQAYYDTDGERITWMRVLCSGYQKIT